MPTAVPLDVDDEAAYSVYFTTVPAAPQLPEPAFHEIVSVPSAFSVTVGAALFQDTNGCRAGRYESASDVRNHAEP